MKSHAKLSASGSHRWIYCPGSVKAEDGIPDRRSTFADEGSAAHELMEICLVTGASPFAWVGKPLIEWNEYTVTQEMAEHVQYYIDYVRLFDGDSSELLVERRLNFSAWVPGGWGTADTVIYHHDTVDVIDLKYGKNLVSAYKNTQGILYLLGAMEEFEWLHGEIQTFRFHIVQPRLDYVETYILRRDELLQLGEWIKSRAELALSDNATREPGEKQCQYCKAKATCPALSELTQQTLMTEFETFDTVNPDQLSESQLQQAMNVKKLIISWLDAVEDHILNVINTNDKETFAGYKLVEGRSLRQWSNDVDAEKRLVQLLGNDAYERKVLSVAKAEKTLGKKRVQEIADLITKPQGKPTLAPIDDPRPSLGKNILIEFESFDD